MTLPELAQRGYPDDMTIGSLAGAGTLGLLIPPSIIMIVYGVVGRRLDRAAVHRRHPSGHRAGAAVLGLHRGLVAAQPRPRSRRPTERMTLRAKSCTRRGT